MTDEKQCPQCGYEPLEVKKSVEENEVIEDGWYCPCCTAEYDEIPIHWEELEFPEWVEMEVRFDDFGVWRNLSHQTEAHHDSLPDEFAESGSDLKCNTFTVWYIVSEDGSVEGPYDEKQGELL